MAVKVIVLAAYALMIIIIGVLGMRKTKSFSDFFKDPTAKFQEILGFNDTEEIETVSANQPIFEEPSLAGFAKDRANAAAETVSSWFGFGDDKEVIPQVIKGSSLLQVDTNWNKSTLASNCIVVPLSNTSMERR